MSLSHGWLIWGEIASWLKGIAGMVAGEKLMVARSGKGCFQINIWLPQGLLANVLPTGSQMHMEVNLFGLTDKCKTVRYT